MKPTSKMDISVKQAMKMLDKTEQTTHISKLVIRAHCTHRDQYGAYDVQSTRDKNGNYVTHCKLCGQELPTTDDIPDAKQAAQIGADAIRLLECYKMSTYFVPYDPEKMSKQEKEGVEEIAFMIEKMHALIKGYEKVFASSQRREQNRRKRARRSTVSFM